MTLFNPTSIHTAACAMKLPIEDIAALGRLNQTAEGQAQARLIALDVARVRERMSSLRADEREHSEFQAGWLAALEWLMAQGAAAQGYLQKQDDKQRGGAQ